MDFVETQAAFSAEDRAKMAGFAGDDAKVATAFIKFATEGLPKSDEPKSDAWGQ